MPTIAEFRAWGLSERGWAPKTVFDYCHSAAGAARFLEGQGVELAAATTDHLKAFISSRSTGASTRNNMRAALVGYFDLVRSLGLRQDNPAVDLARARVRKGLPQPLASDRIPDLIAAAIAAGPMTEALVLLFLYTGVRATEGRLLRWSQVDGEWIQIVGKGGYQRAVYLHDEVVKALERWRLLCPPGPWMFPWPRHLGQPVSYGWVYERFKRLGKKAGIEACRPHRFRMTFGTEVYEATHDLLAVQQALGHLSPANTYRYTLVRPAAVKRAVGQLSYRRPAAPYTPEQ